MKTLAAYAGLAKPGIVLSNTLVAAAAFVFASRLGAGAVDGRLLALMFAGLACTVGSACVFNNVADRALDARMARTVRRALPAGAVSPRAAIAFGTALLVLGIALLERANWLALALALGGFVIYVFVYTPLKPRTGLALYLGAVAGATPPLVGYAAAAGALSGSAMLLFAFMYLWQLPHFLSIARYRFGEYAAAGVPLWVARPRGPRETRRARQIFFASLALLALFCLALLG